LPATSYKFDDFELDQPRFELRRNGRVLKIERIPLELLILLVEEKGDLVTRQEIIDRLWGKDVFVDTEHGINTAIRKIRTALRDDAERPRYIQTVPGKGYRFVAPFDNRDLDALPEPQPALPAPAMHSAQTLLALGGRGWGPYLFVLLTIFLIATSSFVLNVAGVRDGVFAKAQVGPIHSIAVLPLVNVSGDPAQDYYAAGMTDELTTMLAKNASLRVVSRTSAMQYKNAQRPVREIARELGVEGIVEGSVERCESRVHMTVQLIDASTDTHLWAESYDRNPNEAYRLSSELAQTIAKKLRISIPAASLPRFVNPEAHDAYLRGRYMWLVSSPQASREHFERAIQLQPDYADAWSGLADSYGSEAFWSPAAPPQLMEKADAAARKALALDDSIAQAHVSLSAASLFGKWDLKTANEEITRAIELNPNAWDAHWMRAYVLMAMQRNDAALQEVDRGSEINPVAVPWMRGYILIHLHRVDEAIEDLRARVTAQRKDSDIRFILSDAYWLKGMFEESTRQAEAGFLLGDDKKSAGELRRAFDSSDREGAAQWWITHTRAERVNGYVSPFVLALAYARLENKQETLKYLEQAYQERSPKLVLLQNDPMFDFLHADERYRALVNKMGLPPAY
jgi:TolB-like protein/DNA-binding winged helix-turn-helix (wHTH) protein